MALTVSDIDLFPPKNNDPLPDAPPSDVPLITPAGDPWPRPYYLEDGLRRVAPYYYTYNTFCKMRWRDRQLLDIFAAEFRDRTPEYYKDAIAAGRVVINGKQVPVDYRLKNGEVISHTLHRHEPPVTAQPIRVLSEDDDMIVIDKPAGVPVHPAGRYRFNSVVEIMRAERNYMFNPLPCNRLDRLTSGVMFVGKNGPAAEDISQKLRGRTVRKEYLARVKGRFPDGDENGVTVCEENVSTVSPILGLNRVRESGKSAKTLFRRLAYYPGKRKRSSPESQPDSILPPEDGNTIPRQSNVNGIIKTEQAEASTLHTAEQASDTPVKAASPALPTVEDDGYSIVHCLPLTGRTHQLRVHLQFLGHPISNDPIYSNRRVFGPLLGKNDSSSDNDDEIIARLSQMGKTESFANAMSGDTHQKAISNRYHKDPAPDSKIGPQTNSSELVAAYDALVADYERARGEKMTGEHCAECGTPLYSDPGPNELGIYLHAISYRDLGERHKSGDEGTEEPHSNSIDTPAAFRMGGWCYQSEVPAWAWPVDAEPESAPQQGARGANEESREQRKEPTGITQFERWNDDWSPGVMMEFDRETVVPRRMKGHQ